MAKLIKAGTEKPTFSVFTLQADDKELTEMRADPAGFFERLLRENGIPINDLCISTRVSSPVATETTTSIWHCEAPENMKSRTIVVNNV
ncbi:hypothetical protein ACWCPS_37310 [Streptomyces mauvecolor]